MLDYIDGYLERILMQAKRTQNWVLIMGCDEIRERAKQMLAYALSVASR